MFRNLCEIFLSQVKLYYDFYFEKKNKCKFEFKVKCIFVLVIICSLKLNVYKVNFSYSKKFLLYIKYVNILILKQRMIG